MKNKSVIILFLLSIVLIAAGCGDENPEASAAQGDEATMLTLWVYDSGRIDVLTELGKKFEQEYGVGVEIALVDLSEIRNQMLLASGGEEAADIAIIPHDNLGAFVENDAVLEIDLGSKQNEYLQQALDGFTYNGQLYGVPLAVENIGMFINQDLVNEVPQTLEELYEIGKEIVDSGRAEYIMGYPDATYNVFPVYTAFGGYIFGTDNQGIPSADDLGMDNSGFVQGLEWLTRLVKEGYVPETIDWDGAHVLFESGQAPFIFTGPWALNRFKTEGVNYQIAPFPSEGKPFLGIQGLIVSSSSPNALLAKTFVVDFLADQENMQAIFDAEQRPSAWKSIFENSGNSDVSGFNAAGSAAIPMPSIPEMGYVWDAWVNAGALAFSGELSPKEALENAVMQIETQIAESN